MSQNTRLTCRKLCDTGVVLVALFALYAPPAVADGDPFSFERGLWMSSQAYEERLKRQEKTPPLDPNKKEGSLPFLFVPKPEPPLSFSLSVPTLPGPAPQTNEKNSKTDAPVVDARASEKPLSAADWQPAETSKLLSAEQPVQAHLDNNKELNIRMSFLPSRQTKPAPSPQHDSAQTKTRDAIKKLAEERRKKTEKPSSPDQAACAALDAYRQQQLDALQSDRETLKALQNAISTLGFSKQLDFMTRKQTPKTTANAAPTATHPPAAASP
ncbi:MAG: hypothetical protein PHS57_00810 [Alphaproteobacteria bacterium]|nr:hypothetical protein [Alphaproteobacteria bacterium]